MDVSDEATLDTWLIVTVAAPKSCHRANLREFVDGPDLERISGGREPQTATLPPRGPARDGRRALGPARVAATPASARPANEGAACFVCGDLDAVASQRRAVGSDAVGQSRAQPGSAAGALRQEPRFGFTSCERTASSEGDAAWSESAVAICPTGVSSGALPGKQAAVSTHWLLLVALGIVLSVVMAVIG